MSTAVAVFVKTPGLSPVKTRLAEGIGAAKALQFYSLCVDAARTTIRGLDAAAFFAVAEPAARDNPFWLGSSVLHTGEGGLGERQHHIYETLLARYERVLLIGADAPQLSPSHLKQAVAALNRSAFVVGPARDGGYYLFGGRLSLDRSVWTSVPWSTSTTLERLVSALPSAPSFLPMLTDVDRVGDLRCTLVEMPNAPHEEQRRVRDWIVKNAPPPETGSLTPGRCSSPRPERRISHNGDG